MKISFILIKNLVDFISLIYKKIQLILRIYKKFGWFYLTDLIQIIW